MANKKKQRRSSKSLTRQQRQMNVQTGTNAIKKDPSLPDPNVLPVEPAQQKPAKEEDAPQLTNAAKSRSWRSKLLLEKQYIPMWGIILGVITIAITIIAIVYSYRTSWAIQAHNEELRVSKITYAIFISPAPAPGEQYETTSRWEVRMMIANVGPASAQSLVLHLRTPDPQIFLHSEPEVMTPPATAEVKVNKFIPDGIYQVVFKNFSAGDTCFINMFYRTTDEKRQEFQDSKSLFDGNFGRRFIQEFFFTGEKLKVENVGTLGLKSSNEALSEEP